MDRQWHIIPDYNHIEESLKLADKYNAYFEYNDFFNPLIYEDEDLLKSRIEFYQNLKRDKRKDTLHGIFLDLSLASQDTFIREYSRKCIKKSMEIADRLEVKGVVFHTGLIGGLSVDYYIKNWLDAAEELFFELSEQYTHRMIYLENSFEHSPEVFVKFMERMKKTANVRLCLDYAHAVISPSKVDDWVEKLSPYIAHMHINDNDLKSDLHLAVGDGKIDYCHYKELMEKYHINAPTLLEVNGKEKQEKSLSFVKRL